MGKNRLEKQKQHGKKAETKPEVRNELAQSWRRKKERSKVGAKKADKKQKLKAEKKNMWNSKS